MAPITRRWYAAFFRSQKSCLLRAICEHEQCEHPDQNSWYRLSQVHDLPTSQAEQTVQAEKPGRYRRADRDCDRQTHQKA